MVVTRGSQLVKARRGEARRLPLKSTRPSRAVFAYTCNECAPAGHQPPPLVFFYLPSVTSAPRAEGRGQPKQNGGREPMRSELSKK